MLVMMGLQQQFQYQKGVYRSSNVQGRVQQYMQARQRNVGKENDHRHLNKESKIERLLMVKRLPQEGEKDLRALRNSKDLRGSFKAQPERKAELRPIKEVTNTQHFCQVYGADVATFPPHAGESMGLFLARHDIDKALRGRMLDWMIEVTSSYKFEPKTYFASAALMDRYFAAQQGRLPITRLHIVGVISMLLATKMNEVYPLKIKTVFEKIVHKKIEKRELVEMEGRISQALSFELGNRDFYDLATVRLYQHFEGRNEEVLREIELLCEYIGKFIVFNYELYAHYSPQTLSEALLRAACKVYGNDKLKMALGSAWPELDHEKDCLVCTDLVFDSIRSYRASFKSLNNLFKFSEGAVVQRVQAYLGLA